MLFPLLFLSVVSELCSIAFERARCDCLCPPPSPPTPTCRSPFLVSVLFLPSSDLVSLSVPQKVRKASFVLLFRYFLVIYSLRTFDTLVLCPPGCVSGVSLSRHRCKICRPGFGIFVHFGHHGCALSPVVIAIFVLSIISMLLLVLKTPSSPSPPFLQCSR
eukprot:RCo048211